MNYRIDNHGMGVFDVDGVPTRRGYILDTVKRMGGPVYMVTPELLAGEELVRTVDDGIYIHTRKPVPRGALITHDLPLFGVSIVERPVNPDCAIQPTE